MTVQEAINGAKEELARTKTVNASVHVLIAKFADMFEAGKDDPAEIQEIVDQLRLENDALAAAVLAGTPSEGGETGGGEPIPEARRRT